MNARILSLCAALSLGVISCGTSDPGPGFALLQLERGDVVGDVTKIELEAQLAGRTANVTIEHDDQHPIDFPATKTLELANGNGTLSLAAVAHDAAGTLLGNAEASVVVSRGMIANVTLTFAKPPKAPPQLTVTTTGDGIVDLSNPAGATCPSQCTQTYTGTGETVTLNARPGSGQAFGGWTGDCTGAGDCTLLMDDNHTVGATFGTARKLTVAKDGSGVGTVTSDDGAIDCGAACDADYIEGKLVVLTATPEDGHVFEGFSPPGACSTMTGGSCTVTMDAAKMVTARFTVKGIDLTVESITCTPTMFQDSATLACTVIVKNLGDTASPVTTIDFWQSPDPIRGPRSMRTLSCSVPAVPATGTQTVNCSPRWSSGGGSSGIYGPAFIIAEVDPVNSVLEASETNNSASTGITVTTGSSTELVATALTCTPTATNPGRDISCMLTIFNAGKNPTPNLSPIAPVLRWSPDENINTSDIQIGTCAQITNSTPIQPGTSATVTCTGTIPANQAPGSTIYVGGGFGSVGAERSTTNNWKGIPFLVTIPSAVEVGITAMTCSTVASPGANVTCSITVRNMGELAAAPFPIELRLSDDRTVDGSDPLIGTCTTPTALPGGQSAIVSCTGVVPSSATIGIKSIGAFLDPANTLSDPNQANNTASKTLIVGPDIAVVSVSCPPAVARGSNVQCSVVLRNVGSSAVPAFTTQLKWSTNSTLDAGDGDLGAGCAAAAMAPGESQTITCSGTVPSPTPGIYYVIAVADSTSAVAEADETNNNRADSVGIGPNLVTSLSCTPNPVTRGTGITCTGTVTNTGAEATGANFSTSFRVSTDGTIDTTDSSAGSCNSIATLAAGATATLTCSGTVSTGLAVQYYYFGVILDSGGTIAEYSETDNTNWDYVSVQ